MAGCARLAALAILVAVAAPVHADDDHFAGATIIYARGTTLYKADPRGRGEAALAQLTCPDVRELQTDAAGRVLLANVAGAWSWMKLDGTATALATLPCTDGPAQLTENGLDVLCSAADGAQIIVLATGTVVPLPIPAAGARLVTLGDARSLVWADSRGVWSAPPAHPEHATKVAPEPPLRAFLTSPDGKRALGVYADEVYSDAHHKHPADVLMGFALDGEAARRKSIRDGVPLEWSHDGQWVLVQDRTSACIVRVMGGEYKCWKGFTAAAIAPDGRFALFTAPRDGKTNLYRARLMGSAYTETPALVTRNVGGAAAWVPAAP